MINRIQKIICLPIICMCTSFIYINTHTYNIHFENTYMYIFILLYKNKIYFLNIYMHVFVFIYA